jgi:hypothetical protein
MEATPLPESAAEAVSDAAGASAFRQAETLKVKSRPRTRANVPMDFVRMEVAPPLVAPARRRLNGY